MSMRRHNFHLSEQLVTGLKALSAKTGESMSVLIRRAIYEFLERAAAK